MIKRKAYKKLRWLLPLIISFLLIWLVFGKFGFLKIKTFEVRTDYDFKKNLDVEKAIEKNLGQFLFLFNSEKLTQEIKNQDPEIREVLLSKIFPDRIILEIRRRQPLAVLLSKNVFFWLDKEGVIFKASSQDGGLPRLSWSLQNLKVGSRIEIKAINLEEVLKSLSPGKAKEITVKEDLQIRTETGVLIFLPKKASSSKLTALQTILNRFRIEGKRLVKIDLRFSKPVISF